MTVGLIWAQAANGVIGRDNAIPWHLPEDLAHFRAVTAGCTVVMGRRTWESLPPRFRPLPGRRNVVLTRDRSWAAEGAEAVHDLDAALHSGGGDSGGDVWVIGGAGVYVVCLPRAAVIDRTELREEFAGDVRAPELDASWQLESAEPAAGWLESAAGIGYRRRRYRRR